MWIISNSKVISSKNQDSTQQISLAKPITLVPQLGNCDAQGLRGRWVMADAQGMAMCGSWQLLGNQITSEWEGSYTNKVHLLFGNPFHKNSNVKCAWVGVVIGWGPSGKFLGKRASEDKTRSKDPCWFVGPVDNT